MRFPAAKSRRLCGFSGMFRFCGKARSLTQRRKCDAQLRDFASAQPPCCAVFCRPDEQHRRYAALTVLRRTAAAPCRIPSAAPHISSVRRAEFNIACTAEMQPYRICAAYTAQTHYIANASDTKDRKFTRPSYGRIYIFFAALGGGTETSMLKSMTAFGRARRTAASGDRDITAEIKSVNSRYLDCTVKTPRGYSFLEERVKSYLTSRGIVRGKIEVYIGIDVIRQTGTEVGLDTAAAQSYINALYALRDTFSLPDDITVMKVAENREIFTVTRAEDDMERDWADVLPVLAEAVDLFEAGRGREGANLEADIRAKTEGIRTIAHEIAALSAEDIGSYREKLETRIRDILGQNNVEIDENRILTEVAIFADRACIDEELVRLESHFAAMDEILASDEPAGRRLDFLMQEMNREANTIGSKAANSEIAHRVVAVKNELEKIREQIQNIE